MIHARANMHGLQGERGGSPLPAVGCTSDDLLTWWLLLLL